MSKKRAATLNPGLVAGMTETINSWPENVRLLVVQCIITGDVLSVVGSTKQGQVERHPKYSPLQKPPIGATTAASAIWTPGKE